jgi:hypothetical protein
MTTKQLAKVLSLLLLSIPALASAQELSAEWTTYCDGPTERVRFSMIVHTDGEQIWEKVGELSPFDIEACDWYYGGPWRLDAGVYEDLGDNTFRLMWQGWERSFFTVEHPAFKGTYWVWTPDEWTGERRYWPREFSCNQFAPISIPDKPSCAPLPVAATTWGAVKALYHTTGAKP